MRRYLFLVLIVSLIVVGVVAVPSSAVQVVSSTTVREQNTSSGLGNINTTYIDVLIINLSSPLTGTINASVLITGEGYGELYSAQFYQRDGEVDTVIGSEVSVTHVQSLTRYSNLTVNNASKLVLKGKSNVTGSGAGTYEDFILGYDIYSMPNAPINLTYTYNSTGINFSWLPDNTGNLTTGYNFSYTNSYGGWVTSTITNNYSFVPATTGQNISVRVYSINGTGTNAVSTNTSYLSGSAKMVSILSLGGVGYNWSANYSWLEENATWDRGGNGIQYGIYLDSFNDGSCRVTVYSSSGGSSSCSNGYLYLNQPTAAVQIAFIDGFTATNFNMIAGYNTTTVLTTNGIGNDYWGYDAIHDIRYYIRNNNNVYIQQRNDATYTTINTTTQTFVGVGVPFIVMSNVYGNQYHQGSIYTDFLNPPNPYLNQNLSANPQINSSWNKIGSYNYNSNASVNYYWIRNVTDSGSVVNYGNVTLTFDLTTLGNSLSVLESIGINATSLTIGNASIYYSTSDDGISYGTEYLLISNPVTINAYPILSSERKRYAKIKIYVDGIDTVQAAVVKNLYVGYSVPASVSGYVKYSNGTGIPSAKVLWAGETVLTDSNGAYILSNITAGNISIVAGKSGFYPLADIFFNGNGTNSTTNFNFTLSASPAENPNQLNTLSYNISTVYIPYLSTEGHLVGLPLDGTGYSSWDGYAESSLADIIASNVGTANQTPEYLLAGMQVINHLSYDVIRPNKFSVELNHNGTVFYSNHTEFIMWETTHAVDIIRDYVSSTQWNELNNSMKAFNSSWYARYSEMTDSTGYLELNWEMIGATAEAQRRVICGSCVNDTEINNIITKYNYSTTVNGYPQGAELSSNYNTLLYTLGTMMVETGYNSDMLNNTLSLQRIALLNASLQSGDVMSYYRSAGHTASFAQNVYNLMSEPDNRGQAYRFADLQYQKIAAFPHEQGGYYALFSFYDLPVGAVVQTTKHLQDLVTGMFFGRTALVYDNSIVEEPYQYSYYSDLIDGEIVSDALYNSSGVLINNPHNYSVYVLGKYEVASPSSAPYPYGNGSNIMPGYPIIAVKDMQNNTINPMPEVSGGFLGETRDNSYAFPITFNNRAIRSSLNFNESQVYSSITNESIKLNLTNLNYTTKFIQFYNLTTEYNSTADAIDVILNITWDNSTYPLTRFEYGIPFIVNDNRTSATISGNATAGTIDFNRGADTVNISNIQLINASGLVINTSTGLIGYVPFGKSEITTMEAAITQSPVTLKYTHKVSTTNVYLYALNQPPSLVSSSPDQYINTTYPTAQEFTITTSQATTVNWYVNEVLDETDTSSLSNSYTNSSPIVGNHTVRTHYENAQGQGNYTWYWNVSLETVPPASVTNPQTTTGNFWINNTWINPGDTDFNHTWFRYVNETVIQNVSNSTQFLNLTWSPHYEQNISAQTVDTSGNINETKVWFNATIPNNPSDQDFIGNKTVTAGDVLNFTVTATDPDGDSYTFQTNATTEKPGASINATTGYFYWQPEEADVGVYSWSIETVDSFDSSLDCEVITVTVNASIKYPNPVTGLTLIGYQNGSVYANWMAVQP